MAEKFTSDVYNYFVNSYLEGTTPNPCVKCNRNIKFGAMLDFSKKRTWTSYLATGHYATTDGKFFYEAEDKSERPKLFSFSNKEKSPSLYDVSFK